MRYILSSILFIGFLFSIIYVNGQDKNDERNYFLNNWEPRNYNVPDDFINPKVRAYNSTVAIVINAADTIAKVLSTQFGANTTFRNGDGMLNDGIRFPMYEKSGLGSYRFPAGSGSNIYFYDGNIPNEFLIDINPIDGTKSSALKVESFAKFIDSLGAQATVVVNYFYARYGVTAEGTREARVLQAAEYAAGFVHKLNIELGANVLNWEIGNECYGKWEEGYDVNGSIVTGKEYGEDFRVFAKKMKEVDPSIKVGAVLYTKDTDWNPQVIKEVQNDADFFIIHEYFTTEKDATKENILGSIGAISENINLLKKTLSNNTNYTLNHFPVTLTEFNCRGPHTTTMVNALFFAQIMGEIIKNNVGLSTTWVSEWSWKSDREPKAFLAVNDPMQEDYTARPTYMVYHYYRKTFGDHMVNVSNPGSGINVYASRFTSGEIGIVATNSNSTAKAIKIHAANLGSYKINEAHWYEITANSFEPGDKKFYINGETGITEGGGPENFNEIHPYKKDFLNNDTIILPAYSMNYIVLSGDISNNIKPKGSNHIQIHPNPTGSTIWIKSKKEIEGYEIYNLSGQLVKQNNIKTEKINVESLDSGYYVLKLRTHKAIESMNFIKE